MHNLATDAFARSLPNACWALASGARLSIDGVAAYWQPAQLPWLASVALAQRALASQWTGYALVGFEDLLAGGGEPYAVGSGATLTTFARGAAPPLFAGASDSYGLAANWTDAAPLQVRLGAAAAGSSAPAAADFALPPRGCLAYGSAGDVLGGWVTAWRGRPLQPPPGSPAPAVLVAEDRNCAWRGASGVCLRMRLGEDSALEVAPLPGGACAAGAGGAAPNCTAVAASGAALGPAPCACSGAGLVTVSYAAEVSGGAVDFVFVAAGAGGGGGGGQGAAAEAGQGGGSASPAALGGAAAAACVACAAAAL